MRTKAMQAIQPLLRSGLLAFAALILGAVGYAQSPPADTLNQTDAQGRKHGYWIKREKGVPVFEGRFEHGRPVGEFKRYYEDGSIQAVLRYRADGVAEARMYHPGSGGVMALGNYVDQERDSVWTFYTEEGGPASRESYRKGVKHGVSTVYYADGSVSEEVTFADGVKDGPWKQYYPNGNLRMEATVEDGIRYVGKFTTYYEDGIKRTEGKYVDGDREGSWYEFNDNGSVRVITVYRNGHPAETHYRNGTFETYWADDILRSKYVYEDGKRHGPFEEWYNQGRWKTERRVDNRGMEYPVQVLEGTQMRLKGRYHRGEKDGEFVYYTEEGKVWKREVYDKGELTDTKNFRK